MPNDLAAFEQALLQIRSDRNGCWPGFAPQSTPYVVYDGHQTVLAVSRYPSRRGLAAP